MNPEITAISHSITILNGLISASIHTEEYRQLVAKAIAEGRDISDDELAIIAKRVHDALEEAKGDATANSSAGGMQ